MAVNLNNLSIVILSYNRISCISRHLPQLLDAQEIYGFELIAVDNNSNDGSVAFLSSLKISFPKLRLILNSENMGVARGRNCGFAAATGEYVVYLDDDAEIAIDDLVKVPAIFGEHPDAGILAFRIWDIARHTLLNDFGTKNIPLANFAGAAHAIRVKLFGEVGYLDERCRFGGEELDMSIRALSGGYKTIYIPEITVIHHSIERPNEEKISRRVEWVYNFIRIFFKNFPGGMATLLAFRFTPAHLLGAYQGWGLAGLLTTIKAVIRGISDGRGNHRRVSQGAIRFYSSKTLRPEFGNIPLSSKMWMAIRSRMAFCFRSRFKSQ